MAIVIGKPFAYWGKPPKDIVCPSGFRFRVEGWLMAIRECDGAKFYVGISDGKVSILTRQGISQMEIKCDCGKILQKENVFFDESEQIKFD